VELSGALAQRPPRRQPHLRRAGALTSDLGSAPVPGPGDDDHIRGEGTPLVIVYADFECPFCAALHLRLERLSATVVFRHFPVRSSHPRAWPAACAAEAAARQGRFWEMCDSLFADQARLEDPHLWARAEQLSLDLDRFEADRRSDPVRERVQRDFRSGVRGGVVTTPALFVWEDGAATRTDIETMEGRR
jgi:protein-disulfide isomerase